MPDTLYEDSVQQERVSLGQRFFKWQTLLSFLLALAILYFFTNRLDVDVGVIVSTISKNSVPLFLVAFLVYYLTFPLRGWRWLLLLGNVGLKREAGWQMPSVMGLSEIIYLGWFANCIVPAKLGDAYRGYLLKKNTKASFSTTMGTILAERVIDMTVLFALLVVAAFGFLKGENRGAIIMILEAGLALIAVLGGALAIMWGFGSRLGRFLPSQLASIYLRFREGTLGSFRQLPLIATISVGVWLMEAGRLMFVTRSLGLSIPFHIVIFVSLANSILTVLPFTPGGLGVVEAGVVGLLILLPNVSKEMAVSTAILDRVISYWSLVGFGFIAFLFSKKR